VFAVIAKPTLGAGVGELNADEAVLGLRTLSVVHPALMSREGLAPNQSLLPQSYALPSPAAASAHAAAAAAAAAFHPPVAAPPPPFLVIGGSCTSEAASRGRYRADASVRTSGIVLVMAAGRVESDGFPDCNRDMGMYGDLALTLSIAGSHLEVVDGLAKGHDGGTIATLCDHMYG
jgi:hypothetical protein